MPRTIAISDIHGCLSQFDTMLDLLSYKPGEDNLYLLGDYVDRGPQSMETVERVRSLIAQYGIVALRGNHDHRFAETALTGDLSGIGNYMQFGGAETLVSYTPDYDPRDISSIRHSFATIRRKHVDHVNFLMSLPLYHEDETHIYVHAGINPAYENWKDQPEHDFMWIRNNFIDQKTGLEKTVVFGHTVTKTIHGSPDIWFGGDKIGIDGGCAFGLQLNALVIENGEYHTYKVAGDR